MEGRVVGVEKTALASCWALVPLLVVACGCTCGRCRVEAVEL